VARLLGVTDWALARSLLLFLPGSQDWQQPLLRGPLQSSLGGGSSHSSSLPLPVRSRVPLLPAS